MKTLFLALALALTGAQQGHAYSLSCHDSQTGHDLILNLGTASNHPVTMKISPGGYYPFSGTYAVQMEPPMTRLSGYYQLQINLAEIPSRKPMFESGSILLHGKFSDAGSWFGYGSLTSAYGKKIDLFLSCKGTNT